MPRCLFVFGTRPEAIKLCPVILHMRNLAGEDAFDVRVAVTAQHREMLDQVLAAFHVQPDYDLNLMTPGQSLTGLSARILSALEPVLNEAKPEIVFVQGDTTTTLCASLAAFYARIPVGHIEAGLRTGDLASPFPEEMNRRVAGTVSAIHFAPTESAKSNLIREGTDPARIHVTGNTGIDAVLTVRDRLRAGQLHAQPLDLPPHRHLIVVTAHRRESFGEGFEHICQAIREIASRKDVAVIFPVHRNPNASEPVRRWLGSLANVRLIDPLDYVSFVDLMNRASILLTDSGGIQEEGPSLGKPVIVMRERTERPEAVEAGTVKLAGTDPAKIVAEVTRLLDNPEAAAAMSRVHNPYGDGHASERIARATRLFLAR